MCEDCLEVSFTLEILSLLFSCEQEEIQQQKAHSAENYRHACKGVSQTFLCKSSEQEWQEEGRLDALVPEKVEEENSEEREQ